MIKKLGVRYIERPAIRLFRQFSQSYCTSSNTSNSYKIGNPEVLYEVSHKSETGQPKPEELASKRMIVAEWVTPWEVDMEDLIKNYNSNRGNLAHKTVKAVHKLYAYICFNHCQYGILTNYESTYLFRRPSGHCQKDSVLQCSPEFRFDAKGLDSPTAADIFLFIKVKDGGGFYFHYEGAPPPQLMRFSFDEPPKLNNVFRYPYSDEAMPIHPNNFEFIRETFISCNVATVVRGFVYEAEKANFDTPRYAAILKIFDITKNKKDEGHWSQKENGLSVFPLLFP